MTSTQTRPATSPTATPATELPDWNISTLAPAADTVVEASLLADQSAPDGGYGWVIVAACGVLTFWVAGIGYSWGVIQEALVEQGLSRVSTLAFVGSLAPAGISAFAVVNSKLIRLIGARKVAFLGISVMGISQIVSGWAVKSIEALFVTAGLTLGYGFCCCFMVVSVIPAQYFRQRRGLANGLISACGGLGGAVISLCMSDFVKRLGTAWTFRFVGIFALATGLPAAWFVKERSPIRATTFVEWRLFRDPKFAVMFVAGMVAVFPLFVPVFFLPLYARSIGLTSQVGASLIAGFNFSSAIGRMLGGLLGDKLGPVNSLFLALIINAISMLVIWTLSTSLAPLIVFVVTNGMGNGGFFAIMPTVVGNVFGSARVAVAMAMIVTGWTGGYLFGAPIAGYILDAYGGENSGFESYRPAILYAGSMALGASGLVAYVRLRVSKTLFKRI